MTLPLNAQSELLVRISLGDGIMWQILGVIGVPLWFICAQLSLILGELRKRPKENRNE